MKKIVILTLILSLIVAGVALGGIQGSKHDLSSGGPGPTKSTNVDEICVFCHTPHAGRTDMPLVPLWNRSANNTGWTNNSPYTSNTMNGTSNGPDDANPVSKACLSCHDGNVGDETLVNGPGSGTASNIQWQNQISPQSLISMMDQASQTTTQ